MRTQFICLTLAVVLLFPHARSQWGPSDTHSLGLHTDIAAGTVSGVWKVAGSPYRINGEIAIPNDSTLTIEPGVDVVFMGHWKFIVQGRLLAVGTREDSIRFRAEDTQTGWHGIRFLGTPNTNDTSKIVYCVLRNGKANTGSGFDRCGGAMLIQEFDKVLVSSCLFDSNMQSGDGWTPVQAGPAIYIHNASPVITNSTFTNHTGSKGSAILCLGTPKAIISNNIMSNNYGIVGPIATRESGSAVISGNTICDNVASFVAGGIIVEMGSSPRIENNIIVHNKAPGAGGILCWSNTNAILVNNTIAYNIATGQGGGISCSANSDPVLVNNIVYGNTAASGDQVYIDDIQSDPHFLNCNIEGGKEGFGGPGAGTNYTGLYENNMDSDPLFTDVSSDDYRLSDSSPCIGAGEDSVEVVGNWHCAPPSAFGGNPRPSPAGTNPDIGAYENLLGSPVVDVRLELRSPAYYALHQNYPNPLNPSTTIEYTLPHAGLAALRIYNVLGEQVATLFDGEHAAGAFKVTWDAAGLPSGVYFYRLTVGEFVQTRKMVLMK